MKAYPNRTYYDNLFDDEDANNFEPEEVSKMIFVCGDEKSGLTEFKIRDLGNGEIELTCLDGKLIILPSTSNMIRIKERK